MSYVMTVNYNRYDFANPTADQHSLCPKSHVSHEPADRLFDDAGEERASRVWNWRLCGGSHDDDVRSVFYTPGRVRWYTDNAPDEPRGKVAGYQ